MNMASGIVLGFLAGLSAGAIMGILFAPKKGTETRRELKDRAMAARSRIQTQMNMQKNKMKRSAEEAAKSAQEAVEESREAAEDSIPR